MSAAERINQNTLIKNVVRLNFENSLEAIEYKGGMYDIFIDKEGVGNDITENVTPFQFANTLKISEFTLNQGSDAKGLAMKPDGSIMYASMDGQNTIYQYELETPGDVSTASYVSKSLSISQGNPVSICLSSTGTRLYVTCENSGTYYQYNLSTA
jgi:DNA-binding beta-propeller fold protein YncE